MAKFGPKKRKIDTLASFICSVKPKVQLQGYGYSLFCSPHSSRRLAVLVWQYLEDALCARWDGTVWSAFPLIALIVLVAFFHSSQCPDLPLPHGLDPPPSTENTGNKGFSGSGAPIFFGFGLADPAPARPRGRGRPLFAEQCSEAAHLFMSLSCLWGLGLQSHNPKFGGSRASGRKATSGYIRPRSFDPFCALLPPFVLFCAHLRSFCALLCSCVCALLRSFALICVRPRLEWLRLGTPTSLQKSMFSFFRRYIFWVHLFLVSRCLFCGVEVG